MTKVYSPPEIDPGIRLGELVTFQSGQFDSLSSSQRLAIYYCKRAHPDYKAQPFFRHSGPGLKFQSGAWSRPAGRKS